MNSEANIIAADDRIQQDYMGLLLDWKVTGEQTKDALSLVEAYGSAGTEPPLHFHEHADEFFYVVTGTMTFKVGEQVKQISEGGFVWIPRTVVHGFIIESDNAKFLFGFVPAGLERMFAEMSVQPGSSMPDERLTKNLSESANRNREQYGTVVVGPPLSQFLKANN